MVFSALVVSIARATEPAGLALTLGAEGRREAAAIEYRRLALGAEESESAAGWYWWAANEYALAGQPGLSGRMLDRAEDAAPFALAVPVGWLRAENALREREWAAAAFHFDRLGRRVDSDDWREFSARGAAAAYLRERNPTAARQALGGAPGDVANALGAIDGHAGRRDKRPWLGGVLGLVPGMGYVYSGEYANAARSLILNSLFIWGMVEAAERDQWGIFAVVTFGEITWYTGSIYGGIDAAHRHNARRLDAAVSDVRGELRPQPDTSQVPIVELRFDF